MKNPTKQAISLRLPAELLARIDALIELENAKPKQLGAVTRTTAIERLLEFALGEFERD